MPSSREDIWLFMLGVTEGSFSWLCEEDKPHDQRAGDQICAAKSEKSRFDCACASAALRNLAEPVCRGKVETPVTGVTCLRWKGTLHHTGKSCKELILCDGGRKWSSVSLSLSDTPAQTRAEICIWNELVRLIWRQLKWLKWQDLHLCSKSLKCSVTLQLNKLSSCWPAGDWTGWTSEHFYSKMRCTLLKKRDSTLTQWLTVKLIIDD